MKKLIITLLILLLASPCFGMQTAYRHIEPETVVYNTLAGGNASWFTTNGYIRSIKYGSGITLSSVTLNTSNVASYYFLSNPSVDLRPYSGFYATINDGTKNKKVLLGAVGTGETYLDIIGGIDTALLNGDFSAGDSVWSKNTGWTIVDQGGGNYAGVGINAANNTGLYQIHESVAGDLLKASVGVNAVTLGALKVWIENANPTVILTASAGTGTRTGYATMRSVSAGSKTIGVFANGTSSGIFDNFVFQQVLSPSALGIWFTPASEDASWNPNAATYTITLTRS